MSVKVAINGFGRIGRLAFRQMWGAPGYEIVAINDLTSPKMLAHLLKYDSAQGRYALADKVTCSEEGAEEGWIAVDGKKIRIYAEKDANNCPWGKLGVDVVLECTGFYTSKEKSQAHINAGAKKVVISAPAGKDLPTIVFSVNEKTLTKEDKIISAASCTTNCLAPMTKALNDAFPIQRLTPVTRCFSMARTAKAISAVPVPPLATSFQIAPALPKPSALSSQNSMANSLVPPSVFQSQLVLPPSLSPSSKPKSSTPPRSTKS